jgi:hypothetical protein
VFALTLIYFAIIDTLHVARLAGFVAILEAPPPPVVAAVPATETILPATNQSSFGAEAETASVDQDELILSDPPEPDHDSS